MAIEEKIELLEKEKAYMLSHGGDKQAIALDSAIKALKQESDTWNLDYAREDFIYDVYDILWFLPTNDEANRIIASFDRVISSIKRDSVLDKIHSCE